MRIPTTIINDMFRYPDEIVKMSESDKIEWGKQGVHPGLRSQALHEVYPEIVDFILSTIFSQYYDSQYVLENIRVGDVSSHFQRIDTSENDGIIHGDNNDITSIIYLSKDVNCGTSVYKQKNNFIEQKHVQDSRVGVFENGGFDAKWDNARIEHNSKYDKVISCSGNYNDMLVFNGYHPHKMDMDREVGGERLTLITFIDTIHSVDIGMRREKFLL